jgi:hypothetical protein
MLKHVIQIGASLARRIGSHTDAHIAALLQRTVPAYGLPLSDGCVDNQCAIHHEPGAADSLERAAAFAQGGYFHIGYAVNLFEQLRKFHPARTATTD